MIAPKVIRKATSRELVFFKLFLPWKELRNMGMFPRSTKRDDFDTMIAVVCAFFGYNSILEYSPGLGFSYDQKYMIVAGDCWKPVKPNKKTFSIN